MFTLIDAQNVVNDWKTLLDTIAAAPPASASWPPALDCLAGPVPAYTAVLQSSADLVYINTRLIYADRMQSNIPAGAIPVIGDSIIDAMCVNNIHPACVNFGIGGDTLRNVMGHLNKPMMHQAGCVIILIGINDLVKETALYSAADAIANVNIVWNAKLAPQMTGKWIVCGILPVDETKSPGVTNASIDAVNANLAALFANRPGICFVNPKSQLAPNGQLAYHIGDGMHPNGIGYMILTSLLIAARVSLGIN